DARQSGAGHGGGHGLRLLRNRPRLCPRCRDPGARHGERCRQADRAQPARCRRHRVRRRLHHRADEAPLMLQALLASGALFSGVKAEIAERTQRYVFMAVMGLVALLFVLVGLGALATSAAIALEPQLGLAGAVAVVGGGALLIAAILVMVGTHRRSGRAVTKAS